MPRTRPAVSTAAPKVDERRALKLILELLNFPGLPTHETQIMRYIEKRLRKASAPAGSITFDTANKRSPAGGDIGNLIFKLPGTIAAPRRLLMGHVDTVPLCFGAKPVKRGEYIVSADPKTGLGGDNRSGAGAILYAALEILEKKLPHPPLTFMWPVQEEIGLYGARFVDVKKLGNPKLCFNWDGGAPNRVIVGATGAYRMQIEVKGLASHAGVAPEKGVSAVAIAGLAIADLTRNGWHGLVQRNGTRGTSNIGVVNGGDATNVVTDRVALKAEARSHNPKFRKTLMEQFRKAFSDAVKKVKSADGKRGSVNFHAELHYESFKLPESSPSVVEARRVISEMGLTPEICVANGGLDANWLSAHGLPTVTLGAGQQEVHTVKERLHLDSYYKGCTAALRLATAK
ncbi:MAG TPA: M20/M25/M40 family metallo-hydrolase [Planctomycetota bacterium]|nr:M20/M25/M40 family metallo-hydrolase [Planctomycetota bacterium]